MTENTPTDILEQEHRFIEKVVGVMPMLIKVLGLDDQKELLDKFAKVEDAIGRDTHHRFEQLADKLLASLVFRLPETDLR